MPRLHATRAQSRRPYECRWRPRDRELLHSRFNDSTNYVATARVLLRDISKILFPNNPVNVPVIK